MEYIVQVDEYEHKLFCLKFLIKGTEDNNTKFSTITNNDDFIGIISTCIEILMNEFWTKELHNNPSFFFIGANSKNEDKSITKRFRVYRQIIINKISATNFFHYESKKESVYLLLNRNMCTNSPHIRDEIIKAFNDFEVDMSALTIQ